MGRALVSEDTEGTKEAETRQELSLGPACPLWAHLPQCAQGPQEAPPFGVGWPLTPSPFHCPQIIKMIFIFKTGKSFFPDLSGTQGGGALSPDPQILILLGRGEV